MWRWAGILDSLLDLIYPERCVLCGTEPQLDHWCLCGPRVAGLRVWDGPHLCQGCNDRLKSGLVTGWLTDDQIEGVAVAAAAATNPDLVKLVGQFKYHGVRGLAWPLAGMLVRPLSAAVSLWGPVHALVPVSLHPRRRRMRGFNQAEILARLVAWGSDVPVANDILARHRPTGQQAKIMATDERQKNLAGAFKAKDLMDDQRSLDSRANRILLVDDLVTSGSTALAAAASLRAAGWDVRGVLAVGLAPQTRNKGPRVDTWKGGF